MLNTLCLIVSRSGKNNSVHIHQDANILQCLLQADQSVLYQMRPSRRLWLQIAQGGLEANALYLKSGDGLAITEEAGLLKLKGLDSFKTPVIALTADAISGAEQKYKSLGFIDYISKPFDLLELISRVNVQKRRQEKNQVIMLGNTMIDLKKHKCLLNDEEINLTKKEFDILSMLVAKPNEVVSRENIIKSIWGEDFVGETRTVDMHVKSIRKKLKEDGKLIETIYGIGYMVNL